MDSLKLLLRAKAKVDAVDNKKMTALHVAVAKGTSRSSSCWLKRAVLTPTWWTPRETLHCRWTCDHDDGAGVGANTLGGNADPM